MRRATTALINQILKENPRLGQGALWELDRLYAQALVREYLERGKDAQQQPAPADPEAILMAPIPSEYITPEMQRLGYTHGVHLWVYPAYNKGKTQPAHIQWMDENEQLYGDLRHAARNQDEQVGDISEDWCDVAERVWGKTEQRPPDDLFKERYNKGKA